MNKLSATRLDAVHEILASRFKEPGIPPDWYWVVSQLSEAVTALSQEIVLDRTPHVFRHDWTPEELVQQQRPLLTLDHLKEQVDAEWKKPEPPLCMGESTTWLIGDFEIRRRK